MSRWVRLTYEGPLSTDVLRRFHTIEGLVLSDGSAPSLTTAIGGIPFTKNGATCTVEDIPDPTVYEPGAVAYARDRFAVALRGEDRWKVVDQNGFVTSRSDSEIAGIARDGDITVVT